MITTLSNMGLTGNLGIIVTDYEYATYKPAEHCQTFYPLHWSTNAEVTSMVTTLAQPQPQPLHDTTRHVFTRYGYGATRTRDYTTSRRRRYDGRRRGDDCFAPPTCSALPHRSLFLASRRNFSCCGFQRRSLFITQVQPSLSCDILPLIKSVSSVIYSVHCDISDSGSSPTRVGRENGVLLLSLTVIAGYATDLRFSLDCCVYSLVQPTNSHQRSNFRIRVVIKTQLTNHMKKCQMGAVIVLRSWLSAFVFFLIPPILYLFVVFCFYLPTNLHFIFVSTWLKLKSCLRSSIRN